MGTYRQELKRATAKSAPITVAIIVGLGIGAWFLLARNPGPRWANGTILDLTYLDEADPSSRVFYAQIISSRYGAPGIGQPKEWLYNVGVRQEDQSIATTESNQAALEFLGARAVPGMMELPIYIPEW